MDETQTAIAVARDLGVPALLLGWFMLRTDRFIQANTSALDELRAVVAAHMEHVSREARQAAHRDRPT